jgi:TRAP-type C4-dicarboxylate transport system permease small subunit
MALITCLGISLHVFMRYFFGLPINWFIDIATLFLFYITFLGAAWLLRENGHVSLDFLFHAIGPEKYGKVEIITNFICAIACLVITYYGVVEMMLSIELEIVVDMPLAPPKWIVLVFIPLGFLMLAIEFLRKVFRGLTLKKNNQ